ncbi:hypothetical protein CathTA2_1232 [Caldalkalibacillus thermarum TA2.A1]|uniref:Uncharacterized protein n=1 Tax=Caldalkalibacillus thermarum (strain TA2.A1) TaxID=986075 RepID=F5L619_CALTT|nr:hypothetical protein [Caldalkalibacillus thermarum]EGL83222.1 hypothetical protein CathTA2_1232 [Caldalkalibacillus thermarum TA2.A1]QZT34812.1 hypothetical protein HUR95_05980 [Caldalkalibacillus thermarum TA2.A1]
MSVAKDDHHPTADQYVQKNEEYRFFSYPYKENGQTFRTAYFFPRKKGAAHVCGFLVIDEAGEAISREEAVRINQAFNLYNLLFKRFQGDWGDVVEQDLRKFESVVEHFEALEAFRPADRRLREMIDQAHEAVRQVLDCQDRIYQLDLDAIELGKKKREQQYIDPEINREVQRIIDDFEYALFKQYDVQYQAIPVCDEFVRHLKEHKPARPWKKHLKKVKRILKRMKKML